MHSRVFHFFTVAVLASGAFAEERQVPGINNFHVVNEHIYRGAQPSPQGFHNLAKLGVKTIVDLREGTSREAGESGVVTNEGMRYFHVPMAVTGAPTEEQVYSVLHFLNDDANWPVFIHCRRGADRTGTVLACYRIAHDGWPNELALSEAKHDGMSLLERAMQRYILAFRPDSVHLAQIAVQ